MSKYIFVTGGVVSSVGKGITVASLGTILKSRQITVSVQKLDPYLNVDPGTMSPYQHGEVFVTQDGAETDLDLGNYERFIDVNLTAESNVTSGQIYSSVIGKERRGDFLGGTIQVVPHVTSEIKERFKRLAQKSQADVVIIEVGGTVGDIEGQPFLEAIRQMRNDVGRENVLYIHVTFLPYLTSTQELKTKPTQHSVNELRRIGIQPDIIICRSDYPISEGARDKISLFCDVQRQAVIPLPTVDTIYEVPLVLEEEGLGQLVVEKLGLKVRKKDLGQWLELAASYARNNEIPYLGLCLGMHVMVIEFARYALGSHEPNSTEFYPDTPYPVIDLLPEQKVTKSKGGTMRLGNYPCQLVPGSHAASAYGEGLVYERHRHRYEFNNQFRTLLQETGMLYGGLSPDGKLVETCELKSHPWMVSCQFHPEFNSRPNRPHPLFRDFIYVAKDVLREGAQPSLPLSA